MRKSILAMVVAVLVVSATSATAASLITSKQIKDGTIANRDIKRGTISANRLSKGLQAQIKRAASVQNTAASSNPGAPGQPGPAGARGANGSNGSNGAAGANGSNGTPGAKGENADGSVTTVVAGLGGPWTGGDTRTGATRTFGPEGVRLNTSTAGGKAQVLTTAFTGRELSEIRNLSYRTFKHAPADGVALPALNLRVDADADNDVADVYMVFEPYQDQGNAAVKAGEWQTWDAYRAGEAKWWVHNGSETGGACIQATPCTFDEVVAAMKSANGGTEPKLAHGPDGETSGGGAFNVAPGSLGINQGSGNAGVDATVQWLTVEIGGTHERYRYSD